MTRVGNLNSSAIGSILPERVFRQSGCSVWQRESHVLSKLNASSDPEFDKGFRVVIEPKLAFWVLSATSISTNGLSYKLGIRTIRCIYRKTCTYRRLDASKVIVRDTLYPF